MKQAPEKKPALAQLVLESAHRGNILPLTSTCNVRCLFCSHRQNPPDIEVYQMPSRSLEEVRATLDFIEPGEKIVIGESVTRIIEGEPFTHPEIRDILALIRERHPDTMIQLTTNGTLLDRSMAEFLAQLIPLELNLSLNSQCADSRLVLMRDLRAEQAVRAGELLREYHIPYHGSIVAMPHLTGWDDLRDTIYYLARQAARTVRIFLPGYTRLAPAELKVPPALWAELHEFVRDMRQKVDIPLTVEPQKINDLKAEVTGVISGSPADRAGIRPGDVIIKFRGEAVYCRVDAFRKVRQTGGKIPLELTRGGEAFFTTVEKQPSASSGLVMDYDVQPELPAAIGRVINGSRCSSVVIMTSLLAEGIIRKICPAIPTDAGIEVIPISSRYFGGNIMAAGLLTVEDFAAAWAARAEAGFAGSGPTGPDLILIPGVAFDARGRDITGRSFNELGEITGIKVAVC